MTARALAIPLLCRCGLHRWTPWRQYVERQPVEIRKSRACRTCGLVSDVTVAKPDPTRYAEHIKNGAGWGPK